MLFWLVGTSVLTVWFVFTDPRFDYRLLIVGALVPTAVDAVRGSLGIVHSLAFSVGLLAMLMAVTHGRRPIRSTLLPLAVGTLLSLVFTGAWTQSDVFWWPFLGSDLGEVPTLVSSRGWWNVPLEIVGFAACVWIFRSAGLSDADTRRTFVRTGQLALPRR